MALRSQVIVTYALCRFGNIGSLEIQIGVLGQLRPSRKNTFAKIAMSALLTGVLATLTSASIAGMLLTDETSIVPPTLNSTAS